MAQSNLSAKLEPHLFKKPTRLQFGAAISNALNRIAVKLAQLDDTIRSKQLDIDIINLKRRFAVVDHRDIL